MLNSYYFLFQVLHIRKIIIIIIITLYEKYCDGSLWMFYCVTEIAHGHATKTTKRKRKQILSPKRIYVVTQKDSRNGFETGTFSVVTKKEKNNQVGFEPGSPNSKSNLV